LQNIKNQKLLINQRKLADKAERKERVYRKPPLNTKIERTLTKPASKNCMNL
jgi:hypothetical protein